MTYNMYSSVWPSQEQIQWAVQEGADFIIGETFSDYGEAKLAVECIQEHGNGT